MVKNITISDNLSMATLKKRHRNLYNALVNEWVAVPTIKIVWMGFIGKKFYYVVKALDSCFSLYNKGKELHYIAAEKDGKVMVISCIEFVDDEQFFFIKFLLERVKAHARQAGVDFIIIALDRSEVWMIDKFDYQFTRIEVDPQFTIKDLSYYVLFRMDV